MNYAEIINTIRDIIRLSPIKVNTFIHGRQENTDVYKKNLYPLVHIEPIKRTWALSGSMKEYTFDILILDQRDIRKEDNYDKFTGNDNLVDNMNTTDEIMNYLITKLYYEQTGLELVNEPNAIPFLYKSHNLLDGFVLTITVVIPNDIDRE